MRTSLIAGVSAGKAVRGLLEALSDQNQRAGFGLHAPAAGRLVVVAGQLERLVSVGTPPEAARTAAHKGERCWRVVQDGTTGVVSLLHGSPQGREGTQLQEAYENAGYAGDDTVAHHLTAIVIGEQCGVCLPRPARARWTSTYRRSDWF
jgi:hypothetical protein